LTRAASRRRRGLEEPQLVQLGVPASCRPR
jgi:hypothetical protein